ncbi:MAG: hypothetical protein KJ583_01080 [Nanoarchaeota archaeon]|nr:hypothetical protein [Nanoarchaeota archaeon]MBU1269493.1 hypothetical protein [Nanoarchaeota archaeon]MBU1603884.1 hypothetical protein [Nanoarchaeota archaeon]MBU2443344.1 hypothetical protein [Nanoarchaeota archaeon]
MKTGFLLVLTFLISAASVFAQCTGSGSYVVVEGETLMLTAPQFTTLNTASWRITIGDTRGFPAGNIFSNAAGCSVNFSLPIVGNYTVAVNSSTGATTTMSVEVIDILKNRGFGHQCYVIDTSNCADIYVYGDVEATRFIDASELYSYNTIHSYGSLSVGDYATPQVFMSKSLVKLPNTSITGDLNVLGVISNSAGWLNLGSARVLGSLNVSGSTYLYRVNTISNAGNPINITGDVNAFGELFVNNQITAGNATVFGSLLVSGGSVTADNLVVKQSAVVDGNVRVTGAEDRLMGPVNIRPACDTVSPRIYQSGADMVIEIGDPTNKCVAGQVCLVGSDCASGVCNNKICT